MPMIRVNALSDRPYPDGDLAAALHSLPPGAPVIVLVHGYKFSPTGPASPHTHILSLAPTSRSKRAISWPRHLGFGRGAPDEGLCIAFGWEARGTIWAARREAARAGCALARLIDTISDRPVHVIAHSMGARVALGALPHLTSGRIGRLILLAAAALRSEAETALATPAARQIEVLNVTSRENDPFDAGFQLLVSPITDDRALGAGLGRGDTRWLDLRIDCAETLNHLGGLGFPIAAPRRRICHWSAYLRPGLFGFYAAFLRQPRRLPLPLLARLLAEAGQPLRACGIASPSPRPRLPFPRKTSF